MKISSSFRIVTFLIVLLLAACGGGGGSGVTAEPGTSDGTSLPPANTAPSAPVVTLGYGIKQLEFSWSSVPGATYYKLFENPDGVSGYSQVGSNFTATTYTHPIALYQRVNALYQVEACNDLGCNGSAAISIADGLTGAIGYFKASNPGAAAGFYTVALSGDGSTLAVGASGEDSNLTDSGAVYIFARSAAGWSQQAYLKASNPGTADWFGKSVSLSTDGNTLAVGAYGEASAVLGDPTDNSRTYAGAAYVFTRLGTTWSQQAYIKPANTTSNAFKFGWSVRLSGDGNTLAVGAYQESGAASGINSAVTTQTMANTGAVYVFVRSGTSWPQQAYIKSSNPDKDDYFGWSVAISGDGNTLAVGAKWEDSAATTIGGNQLDNSATDRGAVYVFARSGTAWTQQAYIKPSTLSTNFGSTIAMSADGNTLAAAGNSWTVYFFSRLGTSWSKAGTADGLLYQKLSMSADGNTLAASGSDRSNATGLNGDETNTSASDSGAAYLFTRSGAGATWSKKAYIKASNTEASDYFGIVALSADGATLAVGAGGEDGSIPGVCATAQPACAAAQSDNDISGAGAVYLY